EFPTIHPFLEFRHCDVVKDAGAAVIAGKPAGTNRRLADLLAMIQHHWPWADEKREGSCGPAACHAMAAPSIWIRDPDFIVIFSVANRVGKTWPTEWNRIEIICPFFRTFGNFLQQMIGMIVINGIKSSSD